MFALSKFFSMAVMAQAAAALTGLLLARWLSVQDYAIYTVVVMSMGAMTVLTKGGVNLALSSILGKVWPNLGQARGALTYSLKVRRVISAISLPLVLGFSAWLMFQNDASSSLIALLIMLLGFNFIFDFQSRLHEQIAHFANKAPTLQLIDVCSSLFRLTCVIILKLSTALSLTAAVIASVIAAGLRVPPVRKLVSGLLTVKEDSLNAHEKKEVRSITKRQYPLELFYVSQGQIVITLIAIFGSVSETAAVGALGRIGQLFLPITAVINAYAIPRFCQLRSEEMTRGLVFWGGVVALPGVCLCLLAWLYPQLLLILVGDNYSEYTKELLISCFFFSFNALSSSIWILLANRGLNHYSILQIPIFILWCLVAPLFIDLKTLTGVLWFQVGFPIALLVSAAADFFKGTQNAKP